MRGGFRKRADSVPSLLVGKVRGRPTLVILDMRAAGDFAPSRFSLIFASGRKIWGWNSVQLVFL